MKRRHLLLGGAALALGGALAMRPRERGGPYPEYFATLNEELQRRGPMRPVMLLDLDRLDHNIDLVRRSVQPDKQLRVVAKSLPSEKLLAYVMQRADTRRLMAFHQPFLNAQAQAFPDSDILLGKPLPAQSAALFYAQHRGDFDPAGQLQWLIDTPARLREYLELARAQELALNINIELDVGLHRGGVTAGPALAEMLATIAAHPQQLRFSGYMGYEPHVVKLPAILGSRDELFERAMGSYAAALDQLRREQPALAAGDLTLNTAGSPTYRLHEAEELSNDIAVGSAMVQPTDFDIDTLTGHRAAAYIATPVLKASDSLALPGLDEQARWLGLWNRNLARSYFTYGGYWMARYEAPPGLQHNRLFGRSSNQEMVNGSADTNLAVGDQIFLRPTQSEFVFLQFGDLLVTRGGRLIDSWPVFG